MSLVINLKADTGLVLRSDNTTRFYKDIKKFDVMTREEENEWFTMFIDAKKKIETAKEAGDHATVEEMTNFAQQIKDLIVNSNLRLCVAAAKNWASTDTLMDYVNEATRGLMLAVDKFDPARGVKFASYAMWFIKREIEVYHHGTAPIVHRTNNAKTWSLVSKTASDFTQKNERPPSQEELFELVNSSSLRVSRIKQTLRTFMLPWLMSTHMTTMRKCLTLMQLITIVQAPLSMSTRRRVRMSSTKPW